MGCVHIAGFEVDDDSSFDAPKSLIEETIEGYFENLNSLHEEDILDACNYLSKLLDHRIKIYKKTFIFYLEKGSFIQKVTARLLLDRLEERR